MEDEQRTDGMLVSETGEMVDAKVAEARAVQGRGPYARYSPALAEAICIRVSDGESLSEICAEPGMPGRATIAHWRRRFAPFDRKLQTAQACGGFARNGGGRSTYHPEIGRLICDRLVLGMSLHEICCDPDMPGITTVFNWLRRFPDFARIYREARSMQGHVRMDQVWEEARAATPQTVQVARVRVNALKWMAGRLISPTFGPRPGEEEDEIVVHVRRFSEEGESSFPACVIKKTPGT